MSPAYISFVVLYSSIYILRLRRKGLQARRPEHCQPFISHGFHALYEWLFTWKFLPVVLDWDVVAPLSSITTLVYKYWLWIIKLHRQNIHLVTNTQVYYYYKLNIWILQQAVRSTRHRNSHQDSNLEQKAWTHNKHIYDTNYMIYIYACNLLDIFMGNTKHACMEI